MSLTFPPPSQNVFDFSSEEIFPAVTTHMEHEDFDVKQLIKASMNNSSSSGGSTTSWEKPDVSISYMEEDTGKGFVSHLKASLERNGLKTYIRSDKLGTDDILSDARHKAAIASVKISLIILSEKCARIEFLLNELLGIVEDAKRKKHIIMPVFYNVEPSAVRKQLGTYGEQFAKYAEMYKDDKYKVHSWKKALTEAASYSGWDCTVNVRTEHEIVEEITKDVLQKLDRLDVGDLDFQIDKLEQLAHLQQEISQEIHNSENERNYKATLERIQRLKMEKKFRVLRLTPDLLSHMEISKTTDTYF